jgi:hypothetical protein
MIVQSIAAKQVTRTLRALEQAGAYLCRLVTIAGHRCVYVVKHAGGQPVTCYTVTFRKQGVPYCDCRDAANHRGTNLRCKHVLLAERFVSESAPEPVETAADRKAQALKDRDALWPAD